MKTLFKCVRGFIVVNLAVALVTLVTVNNRNRINDAFLGVVN